MTTVRSLVRKTVPFSTTLYEQGEHRRRLLGSSRRLREIKQSSAPIWLDLGGGGSPGTGGWLTVDVERGCDLYWDLRRGLPFDESSVARVYSSHLFEHLPFRDGQALMAECLRVLQPGGSFSICVPNARIYLDAYLEGRALPREYFGWAPAYNRSTAIDAINYIAYMDGHHKYMFDEENLVHRLGAAGFVRVSSREFDPETDNPQRDYESLYAIGFKP